MQVVIQDAGIFYATDAYGIRLLGKVTWDEDKVLCLHTKGLDSEYYCYRVPKEFGDKFMKTLKDEVNTLEDSIIDVYESLFIYFLEKLYPNGKYGYYEIREAFDYLLNNFEDDCDTFNTVKIGFRKWVDEEKPCLTVKYNLLTSALDMQKVDLPVSRDAILRNSVIELLNKKGVIITAETEAYRHLNVIADLAEAVQQNMLVRIEDELLDACPICKKEFTALNMLVLLSDVDCKFVKDVQAFEDMYIRADICAINVSKIAEAYQWSKIFERDMIYLNVASNYSSNLSEMIQQYKESMYHLATRVYECNCSCKKIIDNLEVLKKS